MITKNLRVFAYINILFVFLTFISIYYLDKNFVYWIEFIPIFDNKPIFRIYLSILKKVSYIPFFIFGISPLLILISILSFFYYKCVKKYYLTIFLSAVSIEIGTSIKSIFKFLFSRNNVSQYLKTNNDSFQWLQDIHSLSAFPSGHTIAIVSFLTIFWIAYPKFRFYYLFVSIIIFLALMLLRYHFLSDILAGIILGWFVGYFVIILFKFFAKNEYSDLL